MKIGNRNDLTVGRVVDFGVYLIDEKGNEVLMPQRYVSASMTPGTRVRAYVYNDSEGRPVATTEHPLAEVGDFALMRVKAVNEVGAFLEWGLQAKDLLVPFREQRVRMLPGRSYVVHVYLDEATGRVAASAKLDKFLSKRRPRYGNGKKVDLLVVQRTELGYKVIVDNRFWGLVYSSEIYTDVNVGDRLTGYVKQVRPDGKIDVTLSRTEKLRVTDLAQAILDHLKAHKGSMTLSDKSSPEEITAAFHCSKKDFKKALGQLYRERKITLTPQVTLVKS